MAADRPRPPRTEPSSIDAYDEARRTRRPRLGAGDLADDGRLGLCTGALSSVSGLIVLAGGAATGSLLDTDLPPAAPWLVLAVFAVAAVALLPRRHREPGGGQGTGRADAM